MTISAAPEHPKKWNAFVAAHFPPPGAFMLTWEWGEFQKRLGRTVSRWIVEDGTAPIAVFAVVRFRLPCGLTYAYAPRGPLFAKDCDAEKQRKAYEAIRAWARYELGPDIFLRLEPPVPELPPLPPGFKTPTFYVQPRFNATIALPQDGTSVEASFHPSTRSNIHRAEKRGVTAMMKTSLDVSERDAFSRMIADTIERNSGTNAYPAPEYFSAFFDTIPFIGAARDPEALSMAAFVGYCNGELASMHFVLFFAETATYLYGASRTSFMNSKVDTYLHWRAMNEAAQLGCHWYDLGGIDPARWPSLTTFKRQFRGKEFEYAGNVDIPLHGSWYAAYSLLKKLGM